MAEDLPAVPDDADAAVLEDETPDLPPVEDLGGPGVESVPAPRAGSRYDPEPSRERMRGWLAAGAFGLLSVTVTIILLAVALGARSWDQMHGVAASVLPAVVSVVGVTLGYYFGTRGRGRS